MTTIFLLLLFDCTALGHRDTARWLFLDMLVVLSHAVCCFSYETTLRRIRFTYFGVLYFSFGERRDFLVWGGERQAIKCLYVEYNFINLQ